MNLEELLDNVLYESDNLYVLKSGKVHRKLVPNEDQLVYLCFNRTKMKIRYDRLKYMIYHKTKISREQVVFHRDLDETNNAISNLALMNKDIHFKVLEAMKNLNGNLRLIPHPTDAFSYILEYRKAGRLQREVISDIGIGKKKLLRMQLKFIKFISSYVLTS